MKLKMYPLIERIVESGIDAGYTRAHKHTDTPIEETIKSCIEEYIMNGFDEYFTFEDPEDPEDLEDLDQMLFFKMADDFKLQHQEFRRDLMP